MFTIRLQTAVDLMLPEKTNNYQSDSQDLLAEGGVEHQNQSDPLLSKSAGQSNHIPVVLMVVNILAFDKIQQ